MTLNRAIELLKIERKCVENGSGKHRDPKTGKIKYLNCVCDRDCATCYLVQKDEELLEMYDLVIENYELAIKQMVKGTV